MFAINKISSSLLALTRRNSPLQNHGIIIKSQPSFLYEQVAGFKYQPSRTNGKGYNIHRSNKAKAGLYHGKDKLFGFSIAPHSKTKTLKSWKPNVQKKSLWSHALNRWIRFNATTKAMKEVDNIGGIDQYLINLDEKFVKDSKFLTKYRDLIAHELYFQGQLSPKHIKFFGYDKNPPVPEAPEEKKLREELAAQKLEKYLKRKRRLADDYDPDEEVEKVGKGPAV